MFLLSRGILLMAITTQEVERDTGAGDREKRGRDMYKRREKRGREAGFPRWRKEGGKGEKLCNIVQYFEVGAKGSVNNLETPCRLLLLPPFAMLKRLENVLFSIRKASGL